MENKFKILIVDDEVLIAEFLKDVLIKLGYANIQLAHNYTQAINQVNSFNPSLVLLDIRMKSELEGIDIANEINKTFKIPFIFITSHSDTEILQKALLTNPAAYITKPIKQADVYAAVHLIEKNSTQAIKQFLIFKDGHSSIKLSVDDILYVQSDDNYIDINTIDKKYTIRNTLDWFKENTPPEVFHQTHRSYIVNITKITKSTSKSVFINTIEIPVSRGNSIILK